MALSKEKPSAWSQQVGDDLCPTADVGQPVECPDAGEDEIESTLAQHLGCVIEVRQHERHLNIGGGCETASLRERRLREVKPGHMRAQPRQRDRIGAYVALQMHAIEAADVAEPP
jgi:hypothetical protein